LEGPKDSKDNNGCSFKHRRRAEGNRKGDYVRRKADGENNIIIPEIKLHISIFLDYTFALPLQRTYPQAPLFIIHCIHNQL